MGDRDEGFSHIPYIVIVLLTCIRLTERHEYFKKLREQFEGDDEILKGIDEQEKLYRFKLKQGSGDSGLLFISAGGGNLHFDIESFGGDAMTGDKGSAFYDGNPPPLTTAISEGTFTLVTTASEGELKLRKSNGQQIFHFKGYGNSTLVGTYSGNWKIMS
jgi:hypothetical protein